MKLATFDSQGEKIETKKFTDDPFEWALALEVPIFWLPGHCICNRPGPYGMICA